MTNHDLNQQRYDQQRDVWERSRWDSHANEAGSRGHLTVVDILLLVGVVLGGYFAAHNFVGTAASQSAAETGNAPQNPRVQICSDEELRHMRSGPGTCYDTPSRDRRDHDLEPSLKVLGNS